MSDNLNERPDTSDTTCPHCASHTVRPATKTRYVTYYGCERCLHVWAELRREVRSFEVLLGDGHAGAAWRG